MYFRFVPPVLSLQGGGKVVIRSSQDKGNFSFLPDRDFKTASFPPPGSFLNFPFPGDRGTFLSLFTFTYSAQLTGLEGDGDCLDYSTGTNYTDCLAEQVAVESQCWGPIDASADEGAL